MKKTFFLFCLCCTLSWTEAIDKQKILEIIKAAKQHKSVKIDKTNSVDKKQPIVYKVKKQKPIVKVIKDENIVVYRKREEPAKSIATMPKQLSKIEYGTLPMLGLSSETLRRQYEKESINPNKKTLFTVPQQYSTQSKEKTTATKISF